MLAPPPPPPPPPPRPPRRWHASAGHYGPLLNFLLHVCAHRRATQCASLFAVTPIFQGADPSFLSRMASALEVEQTQPGDWLAREQEIISHVFFIQQGRVEVLVEAQPVAELDQGAYIGEITALGLTGPGAEPRLTSHGAASIATASVRTMEVTTVFVVSQATFRDIVSSHPLVVQAMTVVARLRLARAAAEVNRHTRPIKLQGVAQVAGTALEFSRRWAKMESLTTSDVKEYMAAQSAIDVYEREHCHSTCGANQRQTSKHAHIQTACHHRTSTRNKAPPTDAAAPNRSSQRL